MTRKLILTLVIMIFASGCATRYATPGGGVSLAAISETVSDTGIAEAYSRQPASPLPANLAIVRVQVQGYQSLTNHGHNLGNYSVVTTRDIESDEAIERIATLPLIAGLAPISRIMLPPGAMSVRDLRAPAALLHADMLLVYSVDTQFTIGGSTLGPLSVITLGILPDQQATVTSTVSGMLVDVRTGYVYGTAEATSREQQRTNIWSSQGVVDRIRLDTEEQAFDDFTGEFQLFWRDMTNRKISASYQPATRVEKRDGYHHVRFQSQP